jgi:hypothetical protein
MADLYNLINAYNADGSVASRLGDNTRKIGKPRSDLATPTNLPLNVRTGDNTLPGSGSTNWTTDSNDNDNFLSTSEFNDSNSDIARAVKVIQQYCEVFEIGGNSGNQMITIMVRESSVPYNDGQSFLNEGDSITKLTDALNAEFGFTTMEVDIGRIVDDDTDGS